MAEGDSDDVELSVTKGHEFMDQFQEMKGQEYLTDFKVKVGEREIACHKVVLAARSNYFHGLFSHKDTLEAHQGAVNLETLDFPALKLVIDYCYSGHIKCEMGNAKHIIKATDYLQIIDLKMDLSAQIVNHLTTNNSVGWYFFATVFQMLPVQQKAKEIMSIEFSASVRSPEFLELNYDNLIDYISWEDVDQSSALVAAARWVIHDTKHRKKMFLHILKIIDINRCSASSLRHIVTKHGLQLISDLDIAQEFITAVFSDAPQWQEPGPGAGYDIIVLGGQLAFDTVNRQSWMLNLQTRETVEKACLPREIQGLFVPANCSMAKGALFAGGASTLEDTKYTNPQTQCIIYQKTDNTWAILPELPTKVMCAAAVCIDLKIYTIGGSGNRKSKMDCLDMTTMTWNSCPDLLQGQVYPVVGFVGHCIYVVFSTHPGNELTAPGLTLQCFDTSTSSWSYKACIPDRVKKTIGAVTVTVDHRMFVLGGRGKICLSYDTRDDRWTVLTPSYEHHLHGAAVYLKGKIIICGGLNKDYKPSDVIESYDLAADTWKTLPVKLPKPLFHPCIIPA